MKTLFKSFIVLCVASLASCSAIEDEDLRDEFQNAGKPISVEELTAGLSVTQMPNVDGKVEGDQYVTLKNSHPEIGGTWRFVRDGIISTYGTDDGTIVLPANGVYEITFSGISANKHVVSNPITITVTNVFDEFDGFLTGAADKADKEAKKAWKMRRVVQASTVGYCFNGAHGAWKYTSAGYTPESINGVSWWGLVGDTQIGDYANMKMEFVYSGSKFNVYNADGSVSKQGTFSYNHDAVDELVKGQLLPTTTVLGSGFDDCNVSDTIYWILTLDDKYMTLYHPEKQSGLEDWDSCGWYVFYEAE